MDIPRFEQQMQFLLEIDKLKSVQRQNLLADGSRQENDTEHSWHLAMMVMVLSEYFPGMDILKAVKMTLIHDIVEIYAGDTFAYDEKGYEDKEEREMKAAEKIFGLLPGDQASEMHSLWREFEGMESQEAVCASIVDRLEPFTLNISTGGEMWKRNGVTPDKVLKRNRITFERGPSAFSEYIEKQLKMAEENGFFNTWDRN